MTRSKSGVVEERKDTLE